MEEKELEIKGMEKGDRVSKTKTVYDVGAGEIFWKNFLAGFAKSLGGIFVYIIFLLVFGWIFYSFALPKITPFLNSYLNLFNSLGGTSGSKPGTGISLPQNADILKLLGQ